MHATSMLAAPLQRVQVAGRPRSAVPQRRRAAAPPVRAFFSRGGGGAAPQQPGNDNSPPAASASRAQDTMVSDGAIKSLSPEARRIFREAQDNIIELNKSRLRALDELKSARQKIAELESKLETAVAEASSATAQLQQLGPASSQQAAQAMANAYGQPAAPPAAPPQQQQPDQYQQQYQQYQQQVQQYQQVQQQAQQAAPQEEPSITVVYETGWGSCYIHHNTDGRGWTSSPGDKMDNGNQQFPGKKVLSVPGKRMEFVVNDGGNDWDKPWGDKNYTVTEPGVYRLKSGKLTRLN